MSIASWLGTLLHVLTHTGPRADGATNKEHGSWQQRQRRGTTVTYALAPCTSTGRWPISRPLVPHLSDQMPQPYLWVCSPTIVWREKRLVFLIALPTGTSQLQDQLRKKSQESKAEGWCNRWHRLIYPLSSMVLLSLLSCSLNGYSMWMDLTPVGRISGSRFGPHHRANTPDLPHSPLWAEHLAKLRQ